jgi:hypothetical protein
MVFNNKFLIDSKDTIFYFAGKEFGLQWGLITTPATDLGEGPVHT